MGQGMEIGMGLETEMGLGMEMGLEMEIGLEMEMVIDKIERGRGPQQHLGAQGLSSICP